MNNLPSLFYETLGDPRDPCIILIMGIGAQLIHWPAEFTHGLAEKGFFIITFDNRDAGLSPYYEHVTTSDLTDIVTQRQQGKPLAIAYTLEDMSADVKRLMDQLEIKKAHIVGISMGGIIAQLTAINYPQHVMSLTCIATTSSDPTLPPAQPEVLNYFFSPKRQVETLASYVENKMELHKIYNHPDYIDDDKIRALYIKTYHRSHRPDGFKRQLLALMTTPPRINQLKLLQVPTLIIHGDQDPVFSIEHALHLKKCILNSKLVIINKMGHGIPDCLSKELVNIIKNYLNNLA